MELKSCLDDVRNVDADTYLARLVGRGVSIVVAQSGDIAMAMLPGELTCLVHARLAGSGGVGVYYVECGWWRGGARKGTRKDMSYEAIVLREGRCDTARTFQLWAD